MEIKRRSDIFLDMYEHISIDLSVFNVEDGVRTYRVEQGGSVLLFNEQELKLFLTAINKLRKEVL